MPLTAQLLGLLPPTFQPGREATAIAGPVGSASSVGTGATSSTDPSATFQAPNPQEAQLVTAQLDRILDPSNVRKSVDSVLAVMEVLGYEVEVTVRKKCH